MRYALLPQHQSVIRNLIMVVMMNIMMMMLMMMVVTMITMMMATMRTMMVEKMMLLMMMLTLALPERLQLERGPYLRQLSLFSPTLTLSSPFQ